MVVKTKDISISKDQVSFLLEKLGSECPPGQFVRELFYNAIQAIQNGPGKGLIVWTYDQDIYDAEGVYKLKIVDQGHGMSEDEMHRYINQLATSGREQAIDKNYGLGCRITAGVKNKEGMVYKSWRMSSDNLFPQSGNLIHFWQDPITGKYGLKALDVGDDGLYIYSLPCEKAHKAIAEVGHGTEVILLGSHAKENTLNPPENVLDKRESRWLTYYLNSRFFTIPDGITVRAMDFARKGSELVPAFDENNKLKTRAVIGMKAYLSEAKNCTDSGTVMLHSEQVRVHWWILAPERLTDSYIHCDGHSALLFQQELYEFLSGRAHQGRMAQFGISFSTNRVVLYVEPLYRNTHSDTSRTEIMVASESGGRQEIDMVVLGDEFREKMPEQIKQLQEMALGEVSAKSRDELRERLQGVWNFFQTLYAKAKTGVEQVCAAFDTTDGASVRTPDDNGRHGDEPGGTASPRKKRLSDHGLNIGKILGRPTSEGDKGNAVSKFFDVPNITWMKELDEPELVNSAARYVEQSNTLILNADFPEYEKLVLATQKKFPEKAEEVIKATVQLWYEIQLAEYVVGVQALERQYKSNIDKAPTITQETLTAVSMQRSLIMEKINRRIATI